ncbi:MAG TPA: ABC transporter ATP-binding protein [Candidatus Acidoferrales bacterium]|nr:ABC transporter ATP-binding protein [Candidatus Acidoferrales bacterium]
MTAAIQVEGLSKTYRAGAVKALDEVSLEVQAGETLGIIGPNGAGKTTLLGCLLGFLTPDAGGVRIEGRAPDDLAVRATTGYLPERLVLDRWMSGRQYLGFHHALARLPVARRDADCDEALERVGLDAAAADRNIGRYSRGMLQRLGLAQALLGAPRILYLDEPISGVDPAGVLLFRRLITERAAGGATIVINSHQLSEVERVCTRVVFVQKGRVQSMETVRAGESQARVLRVRLAGGWTPAGGDAATRLAQLAAEAGAAFRELAAPDARFSVADDAGATRLLAALLAGGVPVIEAAPEEGRLERLFVEAPGSPS